jgi:hypothetical protein
MLQEHAHIFKGWRMYVDHQSPEAKRRQGGLPRSVHDLGGIIKESWWDATVPPDPAHGPERGAVVGLARPTKLIRSLIEDDPDLVETSISARATGVRPIQRDGQQAWLVEGIRPKPGSVDWVTEAGAGGKVIALMEALEESQDLEEEDREVLETLTDDEVLDHIRTERPDLYEALIEAAAETPDDEGGGDEDEDEEAKLVKKYVDKGLPRSMAVKAARRKLRESSVGGDVDLNEVLVEALSTEEGQAILESAVRERFAEIVAPVLGELIEAALEDERDSIRTEAAGHATRMLRVRDMRDAAHQQIRESRLPEPFQRELRAKYDLIEDEPTEDLDVDDDVDEETGEVEKTAEEKIHEAIEDDVKLKREQIAAVSPTRVTGQGPSAGASKSESKSDDDKVEETAKTSGSSLTDDVLAEASFTPDDISKMYEGI